MTVDVSRQVLVVTASPKRWRSTDGSDEVWWSALLAAVVCDCGCPRCWARVAAQEAMANNPADEASL